MKMEIVSKAANAAKNAVGITGLKIRKASPEILLGVGTVGVIFGVVMACKATLRAEEILKEQEEAKEEIARASELEEYTEEDKTKDELIVAGQTAFKFVKLYGPSAAVLTTSLALIFWSHGIMKGRNAALVAAYNALDRSFEAYRGRVRDEIGEEKEKDIKAGAVLKKIELEEEGKDGNPKKVKKNEKIFAEGYDPNEYSLYARFFDESSPEWMKDPEYNLMFLKCKQEIANSILHSRGYIFLNEVYDMLGLPMTQAGQLVGWIKGAGDDYVDFGLYNGMKEKVRDFVNGYERSILLDFNVDGVIYDKI